MTRPTTRTILMLGDSLTRGFDPSTNSYPPWTLYMLLAKRYQALGTAVVNAAGSGYNTNMVKRVLPDIQAQCQQAGFKPGLVTLWAGANDSVLPSAIPGRSQHVPLDKYKRNISEMIFSIPEYWPKAKILLITPPPCISEKWLEQMTLQWKLEGEEGPEPEQDRTIEHTRMYAGACVEVGEAHGLSVIDAWGLIVIEAGGTTAELLNDYVPDGLHLSGKGHQLLFDKVERVIKAEFSDWDAEEMKASDVNVPSPLVLPSWIDIVRTPPQNEIPLPVV